MKLAGKVAFVTGASRGIGKAIALAFAAEGAALACVATSAENAAPVRDQIAAMGGRAVAIGARVEDAAQVRAAFDQTARELGPVDVLVNNAGIAKPKPLLEMEESDWDAHVDVMAKGPFLCSQAAARQMEGRGGVIINIGSITGTNAFPGRVAYCASKAALNHMTRVMAIEWAPLSIRVNCLAPGFINTDIFKDLSSRGIIDKGSLERRTPQHRLGEPEEVAQAALFLAADAPDFMTGSVMLVDGGWDAYGWV